MTLACAFGLIAVGHISALSPTVGFYILSKLLITVVAAGVYMGGFIIGKRMAFLNLILSLCK